MTESNWVLIYISRYKEQIEVGKFYFLYKIDSFITCSEFENSSSNYVFN